METPNLFVILIHELRNHPDFSLHLIFYNKDFSKKYR
jgi:hypothetical protein